MENPSMKNLSLQENTMISCKLTCVCACACACNWMRLREQYVVITTYFFLAVMEALVLTTYMSLVVRHEKYNFLANNLHIHERYLSLALKEHNLLFTKKTSCRKTNKGKILQWNSNESKKKTNTTKRMTRLI